MDKHYIPKEVEKTAREYWEKHKSFKAKEDPAREKFYCLSMFPYPSGRLHMGHARNYTIGDVIARYQRMRGKNVLQPMGWDAFGLPAENAAIENNIPPAKWTYENISYMRAQLKTLGFAYDWDREITTCDPKYYRWEQWLFTRLYEKELVYKKTSPVNWCPNDMTVLANEQVVNGCCWRCGTTVERKEISQWFMKITTYADELLADLDRLQGWPPQVITMQRNWIGRSEGVEVVFDVAGDITPTPSLPQNGGGGEEGDLYQLKVFTTRPDTLMGATYVAVAVEHPLALRAAQKNPKLAEFINHCKRQVMAEAEVETMEKLGMDTGFKAVHPITGKDVPIWIANFVLMAYGEGAVMAVPAHDQRDWEFAKKYGLPISQVIHPADGSEFDLGKSAFVEEGVLKDSGEFSGLTSPQAFDAIADYLEKKSKGGRRVNYRLRDWGVSRQRYWGTPIPIINCAKCGAVPVPDKDLPVVLPEDIAFEGVGSPIKKMPEFYQTTCPKCGGDAERETDTFDTFVESSWYYARYCCPDNNQAMLDERSNYWLPVDQYIGGIEHAILHLLYARFYHKLMRDVQDVLVPREFPPGRQTPHAGMPGAADVGLVKGDEPFTNLLTQGMVLKDGAKMSKSKGNTVDPQALIDEYGADTARLFIMFASPPEQSLEWSDEAVAGANRFLKRVWAFSYERRDRIIQFPTSRFADKALDLSRVAPDQANVYREIHQLLKQANYDFAKYQFNTVASAAMKILNVLSALPSAVPAGQGYLPSGNVYDKIIHDGLKILLKLLAPIVPHVTHALWQNLGYKGELLDAGWPEPDPQAFERDTIELVVQVNGKLRGRVSVPANADEDKAREIALADENVKRHVGDKAVRKVIHVPGKLINIVVAG